MRTVFSYVDIFITLLISIAHWKTPLFQTNLFQGRVFSHSKLNHRLEEICEAINKSIRDDPSAEAFPHVHNHMLRHTFATRMREAGADMKATSEMMGHEGILITLTTYTDASREFKSREINLLQDYCNKAM